MLRLTLCRHSEDVLALQIIVGNIGDTRFHVDTKRILGQPVAQRLKNEKKQIYHNSE